MKHRRCVMLSIASIRHHTTYSRSSVSSPCGLSVNSMIKQAKPATAIPKQSKV